MFRGKIIYQPLGFYGSLISPLAIVKKTFKFIYDLLLQLIWSELIQGKKFANEIASLLAFLVFSLLSWLFYYLQAYNQIIIILFATIWFVDYQIAKNQFMKNKHLSVTLDFTTENTVIRQIQNPDGNSFKSEFLASQVRQIYISHQQISGGAFQEVVGTVWQIEINLEDGNNLLIDQQKKAFLAVKKAKLLTTYLDVPIIFIFSEGNGKYAAENINLEKLDSLPQTIKLHKKNDRLHLYSQWQITNSWLLLKQIFEKSGFFLFLLIINAFMLRFGALVNGIVSPFFGVKGGVIYFPSIFEWFKPELGLIQLLGLIFAIAVMIVKGANLSRAKHIYLDKHELKFFRDNQKLAQIKTENIETVLLIQEPFPLILILGDNQELIIQDLQQEAEFKAFMLKLEQGRIEIK